jgi:tRNA threonylcarbamoyladenosine biosynthesis protein TsaE
MQTFTTTSEQETEALAARLAQRLSGGDVIAFRGGLGAGKTAFTRGLGTGLGVSDPVASPTFAIASVYRGGRLLLVHFDMYRIADAEALEVTGYYDFMAERDDVVYAIEWSENVADALPEDAIFVQIEPEGENLRHITISGKGADLL